MLKYASRCYSTTWLAYTINLEYLHETTQLRMFKASLLFSTASYWHRSIYTPHCMPYFGCQQHYSTGRKGQGFGFCSPSSGSTPKHQAPVQICQGKLSFTEVFTILPSVSWVLGIFPSLNWVNDIHIKANRYNEHAECKSISTSIYMKVDEQFSASPYMAPTSRTISSSTFTDCMTEVENTSCNYYYWDKKLSTILSGHKSTSSTQILVFIVGRKCFSPQIFT